MISPDEFLSYLCKIEGGTVAVDLFKIGIKQSGGGGQAKSSSLSSSNQNASTSNNIASAVAVATAKASHPSKMRLALDMEDCLDRFYGGYYSGNY